MLRFGKLFVVLFTMAFLTRSAFGFALVGPLAGFQITQLGYNSRLSSIIYPPGAETDWFITPEWTAAPQNIGEGYRLSIPIIYYSYDPSFVEYFGSNGIVAIDAATAILNSVLTNNLSGYSADLSEFPELSAKENYSAGALQLFDLKSAALEMLIPRLGLADPEHWAWCAHDEFLPPGAMCPAYEYTVIQRNWDIETFAPSKYVNGNLYTYQFLQFCPPAFDLREPFPVLVDPLDNYGSAVATPKITTPDIKHYGWFYTGLTRDDVGGLRYLYSTNNFQVEQAPPDALLFATNTSGGAQLQFTSNLTQFAQLALTNNAAALTALFPGLVVLSSTNTFMNVFVTNVTGFFTNQPWLPVGSVATRLVLVTNIVGPIVVPVYHHIFGNLQTVIFTNGTWQAVPLPDITLASNYTVAIVQTQTAELVSSPFGEADTFTLVTNFTARVEALDEIAGEYFIEPTNECGLDIVQLQATIVTPITNVLASATNNTGITNVSGTTIPLQVTVNQIQNFTNHAFVVYPINCVTSSVALRGGFDHLSFVRRDFDSLLNRFFTPVTNNYTRVAITNNAYYTESYVRVVTRPDVVFAANDLAFGAGDQVEVVDHGQGTLSFNTNGAIPGLNGPGTIELPTRLSFNNVGPVRLNTGPNFVSESVSIFFFNWASFDGSTNAPIVYGGNTLPILNQLINITVSPASIDAGGVGSAYSETLTVSGGTAPYSWSMGSSSPPLPSGLTLAVSPTPADGSQATISGTPATGTAGQYTFWVQATDAGGRSVNKVYVLPISP